MVIRLFLIRHGETENGDIKRYKGHTDVPLSENGIKHMEQLSKYIVQTIQNTPHPSPLPWGERDGVRGSGLNAIYTSDLSRAVKSAEIIAKPHGLKPMIMPELRERSFGIWEGLSFDEIKEKYPEEFDAWTGNPLKFSPMQGESTIEIKDRVIRALDKILNSDYSLRIQGFKGSSEKINNLLESSNPRTLEPFSAVNIAIVSHGGINRIILCHLLGIPLENIFRIEQD
ncbi:MAG: histidine phosphatase family protein [Nitrospirae bacterium]|nr:histidine phosphatase family protein [Nitrospirota bacterium]